ncbi:hypothetical protein D3C78_1364800 [compost metagenome]
MQPSTTARDQHVYIAIHSQQFIHQLTIRAFDRLHRRRWQAALFQRLLDHFHRRLIGVVGLFTATQDHRITGFQAQAGDVDSDVGARFIDHANYPERHTAALQLQAAVQQIAVQHVANRIAETADLAYVIGDRRQTRRSEQQAIQQGFTHPGGTRMRHILLIRL